MNRQSLRTRLEEALREAEYDRSEEIAFHMTDWVGDLDELMKLYGSWAQYDNDKIIEIIMAFLIHVPNHVAAASKLMLDIPVQDIFEVGATKESEE